VLSACQFIGAATTALSLITGAFLLGALVALFGLFAVGAVICSIVWTISAWSGRRHDWLLAFVTPLGLASLATLTGWLFGWL
jgi:hypothetical protein